MFFCVASADRERQEQTALARKRHIPHEPSSAKAGHIHCHSIHAHNVACNNVHMDLNWHMLKIIVIVTRVITVVTVMMLTVMVTR